MPNIPWRFSTEYGAKPVSFHPRSILGAFARTSRYLDYNFIQSPTVTPIIHFVLTRRTISVAGAAAWTSGGTVFQNYAYVYPSNFDYQIAAMWHEAGHAIGSKKHADDVSPGTVNVMNSVISDPYVNMTALDYKWWFSGPVIAAHLRGRFKPRTSANNVGRPWEEPYFWYPTGNTDQRAFGMAEAPEVVFGGEQPASRWEFIHRLFRKSVEVA